MAFTSRVVSRAASRKAAKAGRAGKAAKGQRKIDLETFERIMVEIADQKRIPIRHASRLFAHTRHTIPARPQALPLRFDKRSGQRHNPIHGSTQA